MKRKALPSKADITSEQLILTPEADGVTGIPSISHGCYSTNWNAMPMHEHADIEMCYCSRGSLMFESEDGVSSLLPGNVYVLQPGYRHHLVTNHKGMRMYWLFFRYPKRGGTVLGLTTSETAALVEKLRKVPSKVFAVDPSMRMMFRDIFKAYAELPRGAYRTLILKTLIIKVLTSIIGSSVNRPSVRANAKITRIAKLLEDHPEKRHSVAQLAAEAGISASRFTSLFRQITGLPPYAYLGNCRLQEAKRRLAETNDSITQIAADLGYVSAQHLAAQFHRTFGMCASKWRALDKSGLDH